MATRAKFSCARPQPNISACVKLFDLWKAMPYRDSFSPSVQSTFWAEGAASSYLPQILRSRIPLYVVGGWRDELRDQGLIAQLNIPARAS